MDKRLAGEPGFEPGLRGSEPRGLPLTYSPSDAMGGDCYIRRFRGLICHRRLETHQSFWWRIEKVMHLLEIIIVGNGMQGQYPSELLPNC